MPEGGKECCKQRCLESSNVWTLVLSCLPKQFNVIKHANETGTEKIRKINATFSPGTFSAAFCNIYFKTMSHGILMSFSQSFVCPETEFHKLAGCLRALANVA